MNKEKRIKYYIVCTIALAMSGGCMDAYSFLYGDKVFSNAQTGNLLLLGINLSTGNFNACVKYILPILAFALGINFAMIFSYKEKNIGPLCWQQICLLAEITILFLVVFIPQEMNMISDLLLSFACGIQLEGFRSVNGIASSTVMCMGNLRTNAFYIFNFLKTHRKADLAKAAIPLIIIVSFVAGAVAENFLLYFFSGRAIFLSVFLLLLSFFTFFTEEDPEKIRHFK